jgi:hypothetical protein
MTSSVTPNSSRTHLENKMKKLDFSSADCEDYWRGQSMTKWSGEGLQVHLPASVVEASVYDTLSVFLIENLPYRSSAILF